MNALRISPRSDVRPAAVLSTDVGRVLDSRAARKKVDAPFEVMLSASFRYLLLFDASIHGLGLGTIFSLGRRTSGDVGGFLLW